MVKSLIKNSQKLFSKEHTNILSAAFLIGLAYLASAGLGLIRNRLLAARFFGGQESDLDVYFAAFVAPDTLFQLIVVGALSVAFIPVYTQYLKKGDKEANHLVNSTLNSILLTILVVTTGLFIFATPFSNLISNFPPDQIKLMANLMRIMLVGQLFFTVSAFLTAINQAHRRFLVPAIAPLFYNLGTILGIIFFTPTLGIYGAALGIALGAFLHLIIQVPLSLHLGYRYSLTLDSKNDGVRTIRRLMVPRSLALAILQIERWVAVFFGSLFSPGSFSLLNFSRQLYSLPITLFGVSLGQASFPSLSIEANDDNLKSFKATLGNTLLQILFFSLPASVLLLVLRVPIVRLVFGARSFPWDATLLTGRMVALLSLSIAPQAISQVLIRAFHALHDSKTPLYVSMFTVFLNISLTALFTLVFHWDVLGIALSVAIANTLGGVLLYQQIQKKVGDLGISEIVSKMLFVSLTTGIFLWVPMRIFDQFIFDTTRTVPLILLLATTSLVGLSVYFSLSQVFHVPQLDSVKAIIKKMGNYRRIFSKSDEVLETPPA